MKRKLNWWLIISILLVVVLVSMIILNLTGNAVLKIGSGSSSVGSIRVSLSNECLSQCKSECNGSVIIRVRCRANCDSVCNLESKQQQVLKVEEIEDSSAISIENYSLMVSDLVVNSSLFTNNVSLAYERAVQRNGKLVSIVGHDECSFSRLAMPIIASSEFQTLAQERNLTILLLERHNPASMSYITNGLMAFPMVQVKKVSLTSTGKYSSATLGVFTFRDQFLGVEKRYGSSGFSSKCYGYNYPVELSVEGFMKIVDGSTGNYSGGWLPPPSKKLIVCP